MDRQEIKSLLNYLENNREHLNKIQLEFLASLVKLYNATGVLTKKQLECLSDMKEYIPSLMLKDVVSDPDFYRAQYSSYDNLSPYR